MVSRCWLLAICFWQTQRVALLKENLQNKNLIRLSRISDYQQVARSQMPERGGRC